MQIIVEYVPYFDVPNSTHLWVWVEAKDTNIRALLMGDEKVDVSFKEDDFIQKTVYFLNESEDLARTLDDFIYWIENFYGKI